ncbi:MAG: acyltransferase [Acidimicrobiaceae bacterium]|nr:acyltransferase [Ilumatobacter sp.]MCB9380019.1 acyltransferase [Acidimicrobiaceae bacterium]MCO5330673.1 acyltransferase [Ilumatobacteraceae bacterium]
MTPHHDLPVARSKNVSYLPGVDHLRGFAAFYIVAYHGGQRLRGTAANPFPTASHPGSAVFIEGHTAVALFMVLSGFILTYGADRREVRYGGFMRNRVLRVVPMYVVVMAIAMFTTVGSGAGGVTFGGVLPYFTLLATPPFPFADLGVWSAVLWSVSVEFAFYLVFPFLLRFLQRYGARYLVGVLAMLNLLRLLVAATDAARVRDLSYWTIVGRLDQFVLGMLAAWCLRRGWVELRRRWWATATASALVALALALWWFNRHGSFYAAGRWRAVWPLAEGALWAAVVLGWVAATKGLGHRLARWLTFPGLISYSVYLLHYPVVAAVRGRGWTLVDPPVANALLLTVLVVVPVVAALATLCYLVVERPFMELRVRYLSDAPGGPAAST